MCWDCVICEIRWGRASRPPYSLFTHDWLLHPKCFINVHGLGCSFIWQHITVLRTWLSTSLFPWLRLTRCGTYNYWDISDSLVGLPRFPFYQLSSCFLPAEIGYLHNVIVSQHGEMGWLRFSVLCYNKKWCPRLMFRELWKTRDLVLCWKIDQSGRVVPHAAQGAVMVALIH